MANASGSPSAGPSVEPIVHTPTPRSRPQPFAAVGCRQVGPPVEVVGVAGHLAQRLGALGLDPERVEPPRRSTDEPRRLGRQQQPDRRVRAPASPSRRTSRHHWATASPAVIRWAMITGSSSWYSVPLAPRRRPGWSRTARPTAGCAAAIVAAAGRARRRAPEPGRATSSPPAPHAWRVEHASPRQRRRSVPGPSGVSVARQNSPARSSPSSRVVGSTRPVRYTPSVVALAARAGSGAGHGAGTGRQHRSGHVATVARSRQRWPDARRRPHLARARASPS